MKRISLLLAFLLVVRPAAAAPQGEILVAAAASLRDALTQIGADYQKARPEVKVTFNFASSGVLQQQVKQGAPVDVFIAAADENVDALAKAKLVDAATRRVIATNRLVLIVRNDAKTPLKNFQDVAGEAVTHVAIGAPGVPAGVRAQEVFEHLGVWPKISDKAVRCADVRAVLVQVEQGNVEAGVVYATDAQSSKLVRVAATARPKWHNPIRYPAAVVSGARNPEAAQDFVKFLGSKLARATLKKLGFGS